MRKSGLLLIIFVLLLSQFGGLPAYAASDGDFDYEVNDDGSTVTITGYASGAPKDVVIPNMLGGMDVTVIGDSAFRGSDLTSVDIPLNVTTIEYMAFGDNNLRGGVTIPNSVITIESYAFYSSNLLSVTIPDSVTTIGDCAFIYNNLKVVTIPASVTVIGKKAFSGSELTEVTISNDSTVIGDDAFDSNDWGDVGNFTLYGYNEDSTAKKYADNKGLPLTFALLDKNVTYDGNNQTSGDVPVDKRTYGGKQEVTVLGNVNLDPLLKDGFTFSGWNTSVDGTGDDHAVGSTFPMGEEEVTLYATWTQPVASTKTYYVKENATGKKDGSSWEDAFDNLQAALDKATVGNQIRIAQGTYYPTKEIDTSNPRTATFQMINGVAIYGGFAGDDDNETVASRDWKTNETILSGDLGKDDDPGSLDTNKGDNAYHIFYHPAVTNLNNTAVLDGVSIVGGNADDYFAVGATHGGGMYNHSSSPKLTNVTLSGNTAYLGGGGMYNMNSHPILADVILSNNRVWGGSGGEGGGLYNDSSNPVLTNVVLRGNFAYFYGGGMYNEDSHPVLTNVTISGNGVNNPGNFGGGMYNRNSNPIIDKSIIWGNTSPIQNAGSSGPTFKDSIIEGSGGSGISWNLPSDMDQGGNLDVDPRFVDPKNFSDAPTLEGDYRLLPGSPAIPEMMGALGVYELETKHTLIFEVDGVEVSREDVVKGQKATNPNPPTKSEYTFVGWYEDVNADVEWDFVNNPVTKDTTLYAKWTPFTYKNDLSGTGVEIIRYASTAPKGDVEIPGMLGGKPVTVIGGHAFNNIGLTKVTIPNSVKVIGEAAFGNNKLTHVDIPYGVETIGKNAFAEVKLRSVTIPNSVKTIGESAFYATKFTDVDIPGSVEVIAKSAFEGSALKSVTIQDGVKNIGESAFDNSKLEEVDIPGSVEVIGDSAFAFNGKLKKLTIQDGVQHIGESAFARHSLSEVDIPGSVEVIGNKAFEIGQLNRLTIRDGVKVIGGKAFHANALEEVDIPSSVNTIGDSAFNDNKLNKVEFAGPLTTGNKAFDYQNKAEVSWYIDQDFSKSWTDAKNVSEAMIIYTNYKHKVISVTLDPSELNLTAGGSSATLIATINPSNATDQNVTWSSNHPTIASVDGNGVVTPKSAGTTTITVTTEDGDKTATSLVTVRAANIPVTSVTLNPSTLNLTVGGSNATLIATINPSNATNQKVTWSSDNPTIASVDENGVVTPKSVGEATITVMTEDDSKTATSLVVVKGISSGGGGGIIPTYTLTFESNGESAVATQSIAYNEKVVKPTIPTKAGYTFAGWYKEVTFTNEWNFTTDVVKENTILYAKWTIDSTSDDSLTLIPVQPSEPMCTADFTDTATHWAKKEIDEIACLGIIIGYPDGAFKPNKSITREHVALMFTRAFELAPIRSSIEFNDVPTNHRYYDAITQVYRAGIFDGASNGKFNPDAHMTRAQMAKVLVLAFELQPSETSTNVFRDVPATHWAKDYIATLADNGIALGDNGNFKPEESVTRAQFVAFMYRALNL